MLEPYLKPLLATGVLAVLWLLESMAPVFPVSENRIRHDASNVALGVLNAVLVAALLAGALVSVVDWAQQREFGLLHQITWPPWIETVLALVLFDLWQYGWHRMNHRLPVLWRFHAVHHSDAGMDATTALRFHTVEILLSTLLRMLVLPLIGMSVAQLLLYELCLMPVILFHHSNVRIPDKLDRVLRVLIVTPGIHRVHHSDIKTETDSNYASLFAGWDLLFGSRVEHRDLGTLHYGLGDRFRAYNWLSLPGMLQQPFISRLYRD